MSKYKTTHLPPTEIDRLRFKAFSTNSQEDVEAYYKAACLYFQERHERAMNRDARIAELEAKLAKIEEIIELMETFSDRALWKVIGKKVLELKGETE